MSWLVEPNPDHPYRWMLIDTREDEKPRGRGRVIAQFDDGVRAQVVADLLAGADPEYRSMLDHLEQNEPF